MTIYIYIYIADGSIMYQKTYTGPKQYVRERERMSVLSIYAHSLSLSHTHTHKHTHIYILTHVNAFDYKSL